MCIGAAAIAIPMPKMRCVDCRTCTMKYCSRPMRRTRYLQIPRHPTLAHLIVGMFPNCFAPTGPACLPRRHFAEVSSSSGLALPGYGLLFNIC